MKTSMFWYKLAGAGLLSLGLLFSTGTTALASCPAATVADMKGVKAGKYPQQFELSEFERNAGCKMTFKGNPDIAKLNAKIRGNTRNLPPVEQRLPSEPLIYAPYDSIGKYGGTLDVLSNATEAGTSDFLSVRHVNLVRYLDDLTTIVPNVATLGTMVVRSSRYRTRLTCRTERKSDVPASVAFERTSSVPPYFPMES